MSDSTHSFLGLSGSREDTHLFPEIRSYTEMSSCMNECTDLFTGMDSRLYIAAEEGNVDALNKLIEAEEENADAPNGVINGRVKLNIFQQFTGLGNSILHIAVSRGNLRFVEKLLDEVKTDSAAEREFIRAKNSEGNSALHFAALYGHDRLVEKFLKLMEGDVEAGCNFLRSDNSVGNTALHEAAKGGNYKIVDVLLNRDAGLARLPNREGETALFIASQGGHKEIVERLLPLMESNDNMKRRDGQTPLHSAVFCGYTGVVEKLLEGRPDLAKQTDVCERTAMHMLAFSPERDSVKIAGLLLAKDNSLCYKQDNKKQTPLHMAVEWETYDLVDILLIYGRDCREMVDKDGRKPLHLAIINVARVTGAFEVNEIYRFKIMLLSLMSRESLNHRDNRGRTPLHIASENIEKDSALYYSIRQMLKMNGALVTPEIFDELRKIKPAKTWIKSEKLSINAVLIATVSFAAAFTLPGGLDAQTGQKPKALYMHAFLFKLFLISDAISFCTSITSVMIVQFAEVRERQDRPLLLLSTHLLWSALISLVVAFGAALHLVIAPSPWLVSVVWTMVSLVPISICVARAHSKVYLFVQERHKIWVALQILLNMVALIFLDMLHMLNIFSFGGIFHMAVWIKKSCQMMRVKESINRVQLSSVGR